MPVYVYETIPQLPDQPVRRFELKQPMSAAALTKDPQTGQPVRRLISGGYGVLSKGGGSEGADRAGASSPPSHSCGTGCGCFPS